MEEISFHIETIKSKDRGFILSGMLALPYQVTTAAWLLPMQNELRIIINTIANAVQLSVNKINEIIELRSLDSTIAGVAEDDNKLFVTTPVPSVVAINEDGSKDWEYDFDGAIPTIWPKVFISKAIQVVWQIENGLLETATIDQHGFSNHKTYTVGDKPLFITSDEKNLYCAWKKNNIVEGIKIGVDGILSFQTAAGETEQIKIANENDSLLIVLANREKAELVRFTGTANTDPARESIKFPEGVNEISSIITGRETVFLLKKNIPTWEEEQGETESLLFVEGYAPLIIKGFIHNICWWGNKLAILGTSVLYFVELNEKKS